MELTIREIPQDQVYIIKELWKRLNALHLKDSTFFKDYFRNFTFEQRSQNFQKYAPHNILINVVYNDNNPVGYCISTVSEDNPQKGEIDSLFIDYKYRKYGYGKALVEKSIKWFKKHQCRQVEVAVAEGHESVLSFYQKFGLYPRKTFLTMREPL